MTVIRYLCPAALVLTAAVALAGCAGDGGLTTASIFSES